MDASYVGMILVRFVVLSREGKWQEKGKQDMNREESVCSLREPNDAQGAQKCRRKM